MWSRAVAAGARSGRAPRSEVRGRSGVDRRAASLGSLVPADPDASDQVRMG